MALQVEALKRVFKINDEDDDEAGNTLPDPNPQFTPQEVMEFYSATHPELTTARIVGPKVEDGNAVYSLATNYGTKG